MSWIVKTRMSIFRGDRGIPVYLRETTPAAFWTPLKDEARRFETGPEATAVAVSVALMSNPEFPVEALEVAP